MKTYALRFAGSKKFVGVVRAANLVDLFDNADELRNPHDYEYQRIPSDSPGGMIEGVLVGLWPALRNDGWVTFEALAGKPFPAWYAEDYIPAYPLPQEDK